MSFSQFSRMASAYVRIRHACATHLQRSEPASLNEPVAVVTHSVGHVFGSRGHQLLNVRHARVLVLDQRLEEVEEEEEEEGRGR